MKVWPPAGTRYDCWCGAVAIVPFRPPKGPGDREEPYAECPSKHRSKLASREVPDPIEDPSGPASLFVIVRAGTTLAEAEQLLIHAALERSRSSVAAAARELGVSAPWLGRWMRRRSSRSPGA